MTLQEFIERAGIQATEVPQHRGEHLDEAQRALSAHFPSASFSVPSQGMHLRLRRVTPQGEVRTLLATWVTLYGTSRTLEQKLERVLTIASWRLASDSDAPWVRQLQHDVRAFLGEGFADTLQFEVITH